MVVNEDHHHRLRRDLLNGIQVALSVHLGQAAPHPPATGTDVAAKPLLAQLLQPPLPPPRHEAVLIFLLAALLKVLGTVGPGRAGAGGPLGLLPAGKGEAVLLLRLLKGLGVGDDALGAGVGLGAGLWDEVVLAGGGAGHGV
jgi:hypothetical protein